MKVGRISFMQMTAPADHPKSAKGSKYQGLLGPTPNRYFENFG